MSGHESKIVSLNVVEPDVRQDTIERLESALAEAKRGEIREIFLIGRTHDGWRELSTPTNDFTAWIGRLEVSKHNWIAQWRRNAELESE